MVSIHPKLKNERKEYNNTHSIPASCTSLVPAWILLASALASLLPRVITPAQACMPMCIGVCQLAGQRMSVDTSALVYTPGITPHESAHSYRDLRVTSMIPLAPKTYPCTACTGLPPRPVGPPGFVVACLTKSCSYYVCLHS